MATGLAYSLRDRGIDLSATRAHVTHALHLPGYFYTSPEIYELEVEHLLMKAWLCVGRLEQYEQAGDYRAMRIAGEPLLICRDEQGNLNAFHNVCRHRGVEVATGAGNGKQFTCPYHAWSYNLQGKLLGAPLSKAVEGFDLKNCALPRVKLETWGGYIFVNFDPQSASLSDYLDDEGAEKFGTLLRPEDTRLADALTFELDCNWKFVRENLMDLYHVKAVHGASFGKRFPDEVQYHLLKDGRFHAEYEAFTMAPDGLSLFGTMPWLKEKRGEHFACTLFIAPNFNLFGRHDLIQPWVSFPLGPERTQVTIYTQFPKDHFALPAFKERNGVYKDFIRLVASEDGAMLRSLQNGVRSRAFAPGPMVALEEAIHHHLNHYLDRMFGADAGAASACGASASPG